MRKLKFQEISLSNNITKLKLWTLADLTPKSVLHSSTLPKLPSIIIVNHCFLHSKCGCPCGGERELVREGLKGSYWAVSERWYLPLQAGFLWNQVGRISKAEEGGGGVVELVQKLITSEPLSLLPASWLRAGWWAKAQGGPFHGLCTSKDLIPGTAVHIVFQRAQSYGWGKRTVSRKCLRKA